jgi:vacuolar fusion protein MON1
VESCCRKVEAVERNTKLQRIVAPGPQATPIPACRHRHHLVETTSTHRDCLVNVTATKPRLQQCLSQPSKLTSHNRPQMAQGANGHLRDPLHQTSESQETPKQSEHVSNTDLNSTSSSMPESGPTTEEAASREGTPPPLPPRPKVPPSPNSRPSSSEASLRLPPSSSRPRNASRPPLQSKATTALYLTDVHTQSHGGNETLTSPTSRRTSFATHTLGASRAGSDADDTASVRSFAPTMGAAAEIQSMLGDVLPVKPMAKALGTIVGLGEKDLFPEDVDFEDAFEHEFDELDDITSDGLNEEAVIQQWKSKLKHFMILSSAGKPIWTRHGNDQIISSYIGVVQTLISFYQGASDVLRGFTAAGAQFVVMTRGSLNLVAISKIDESDPQLRTQLEALYMQILSTLTLPVMERMFKARASTDLRRPLQGTEKLLSALADGFTRGSPSTLLSALECLKIRKSHRNVINNSLLKTKCSDLLYGLIVAGGRLVSVVRPRKHSLHPGDLHLIFNMLFEAGSVKAGGGENWIPLCLPGFNNTGYLYMYVSFLNLEHPSEELKERPASSDGEDGEVAILLISTNRESFYELRQMRDDLVEVSNPTIPSNNFKPLLTPKTATKKERQPLHNPHSSSQRPP